MNKKVYSNKEFTEIKKRLNEEILRRGGFAWMDPLSTPKVGTNRKPPLSLPDTGAARIPVDDRTYTINNPSEGSIEPTKNIHYPATGDNPANTTPEFVSVEPNTSAANFSVGELKNFIVGLSKIDDINLFYGRDEKAGMVFRDPQGIEDLLSKAEKDKLHEKFNFEYSFRIEDGNLVMDYSGDLPDIFIEEGYLYFQYEENGETILSKLIFDNESGDLIIENGGEIMANKDDPNGGDITDKNPNYPVKDYTLFFPIEDDVYVLPSGEYDGEELTLKEGIGPNNFFDDYGAQPGDGNYHPYNVAVTPISRRDIITQDNNRHVKRTIIVQGGRRSSEFGPNPRNPQQGNQYKGYPIYKGSPSSCNNLCTGLCYTTCDDMCSESCSQTCTMRCGNACSSSCGNACTGCSSQCFNTCKTKCENNEGYACVKSGAKVISIDIDGNKVVMHTSTYSCTGCSYSCQFYPNKKTTCWDAGCMGKCFISCNSACSDSCKGGCIGDGANGSEDYKSAKGTGCSAHCTMNCTGACKGVCEGQCTTTCFSACKQQCSDNCEFTCATNCGSGCATTCTNGCKNGCFETCENGCKGETDQIACINCGSNCFAECMHNCNSSCFNKGCNAVCGTGVGDACSANCKMNCSGTSCTALCSDACSDQCTTCVNTCGFECGGSCSQECGYTCDTACRYKCTETCAHTCESNCVQSCTEECGACSGLCYSCVGACVGVCAYKCENGCSMCANNCGYWCDQACNQNCFSSCDTFCLSTCKDNCATKTYSETTHTTGPERKPTAYGYNPENPSNREEEMNSFLLDGRSKIIKLDPFHFHMEDDNLYVEMPTGTNHLKIIDDSTLILIPDDSYQDKLLMTYQFEIEDDGSLYMEYIGYKKIDVFDFKMKGGYLLYTIKDVDENHLSINEDELVLEDENTFPDFTISKYKFEVDEEGILYLVVPVE